MTTATHPGTAPASPPLLEMRGISKSFAGSRVLDAVNFALVAGEVHVLAGENGAGKSTLIKTLAGVYPDYGGEIRLGGQLVRFQSPHEATACGISVIYQEMSLIPSMSVVDNIFLGRESTRAGAWMNWGVQERRAAELIRQLGLQVDLHAAVEQYPVPVQQMIEIAKALAFDARIIVMDEPTSALNDPEVDRLFQIIGDLKRRGCGIVYISHKMEEIYRIGDRITVLRDGRYVNTANAADLPARQLVRWLVGRDLNEQFPARATRLGNERIQVRGLHVPDLTGARRYAVENASFAAAAGEVVGFAGLQGSGNSDLFHGLFGSYGRLTDGSTTLDGAPLTVGSPADALRQGVALLTNDRKGNGLVAGMGITQNITLASLPRFSPVGWLRPKAERATAARHHEALHIRLRSLEQPVRELSGGNQQKVVLAKWLETQPKVLLLDEPTRGVDVGAKHEIYELINQWTAEGITILLITSEMPELLALADRIMVMHRGQIRAAFARGEATQEKIAHAAMGD